MSSASTPSPSLSQMPPLDPKTVPVLPAEESLPRIADSMLTPDALIARFESNIAWTPEVRSEPKFTNREPAAAAVLIPLVLRVDASGTIRPTVLLTQRTTHLSTHSGQIAFPGGRVDETDDSVEDAALREAHEEVGLDRRFAKVIGKLPTYTTGTSFVITPVIALIQPDFTLQLNPYEVDAAFEVPLAFLMDPSNHRRHAFERDGIVRHWYSMPYDDAGTERFVWGATAGIIRNLYRFLSASD